MRHRELTFKLAALTLGMFCFGFALVPLYAVFCDLTGLNGRTANAAAVVDEEHVDAARTVRVEFLASVGPTAPWEFAPRVSSMDVHPGGIYAATFAAHNLTPSALTAQAVPSVSPGVAARYFKKIQCFCFTTQDFAPNEERELSVRFVVDPELPERIDALTLAYTLYAVTQ